MALGALPLFEPDEVAGTGDATMARGGPFANALVDGFDACGASPGVGAATGTEAGAREITTSPDGIAATGAAAGALDATAADGEAGAADGDDDPSVPSECGCSPLT